ncbi:hypothetical protein P344_06480 [Spiroplasma mirum ATCC 29335]|uniref:Uncharacterized protein n=1 Tax=Spiroplasma mirum ATCC 29335 TaxID=838561 RepID=W0GS41_9MOLU|nr:MULTISPECIES: hypothetical protein [Spiroplasma]AHF61459.1 hypothetical protein SMM_1088 [Spiroplasma mirum ATCC 29335]AHI58599.1 hypothetical protein P344_06480 [Spiroplasma mirum ATCC 29335]AKM53503.1 hypothetical protein SATRI_v1c11560 [Spiroplasma atrichopogonis]
MIGFLTNIGTLSLPVAISLVVIFGVLAIVFGILYWKLEYQPRKKNANIMLLNNKRIKQSVWEAFKNNKYFIMFAIVTVCFIASLLVLLHNVIESPLL